MGKIVHEQFSQISKGNRMRYPLVLSEVKEKLSGVVSESFKWPEIPKGWQRGSCYGF